MVTLNAPLARRLAGFLPHVTLRGLIDAVIEADRRYRESRRLNRLEYPYLRDMGIDFGRGREAGRD